MRPAVVMLLAIAAALLATALLAFGGPAAEAGPGGGAGQVPRPGVIDAVAAENQYGNVIAQVGGAYVRVTSLLSNPSTDPHSFEASVAVARQVGRARLVVQNGLGYDSFATSITSAAPNPARTVIDVRRLLGLPDSAPNPHLWYNPATMPKVADAIAADLGQLDPPHASYYKANAARFTASLSTWTKAMAAFKAAHPDTPVATTEPVADYLLQAAGTSNLTPWAFQADVMNGTDPSPQLTAAQNALFSQHKVKVFLYNQQVTDSLTDSIIKLASKNGIPVVGVYETMPAGYTYQTWMEAEINALNKAVTGKTSTQKL